MKCEADMDYMQRLHVTCVSITYPYILGWQKKQGEDVKILDYIAQIKAYRISAYIVTSSRN